MRNKANKAASFLLSLLVVVGFVGMVKADLNPTGTVIRQIFDGASGRFGKYRISFDGTNNYAVFGSSQAPQGAAIGATVVSSGTFVAQSTSATSGYTFFRLLNQAGTLVLSLAQGGDLTLAAPGKFLGDGSSLTGVPGTASTTSWTGSNTFGNLTSSTTFNNIGIIGANAGGFFTAPTRQVFLSGTAQTYTTPLKVRQLKIRIVAGGGGGAEGSGGATGTVGVDSSFNSIVATGGGGGTASGAGGAGGTGGSGSASLRIAGGSGDRGLDTAATSLGARGGVSAFGGGAGSAANNTVGLAAAANSGGGGSGGITSGNTGGGGGGGEYIEIVINAPSATYTYTVGTGGPGGTGGAGADGGAGGSGIIIVDEIY